MQVVVDGAGRNDAIWRFSNQAGNSLEMGNETVVTRRHLVCDMPKFKFFNDERMTVNAPPPSCLVLFLNAVHVYKFVTLASIVLRRRKLNPFDHSFSCDICRTEHANTREWH